MKENKKWVSLREQLTEKEFHSKRPGGGGERYLVKTEVVRLRRREKCKNYHQKSSEAKLRKIREQKGLRGKKRA